MTLVVLGLDALDAGLVEYFDCDNLRLESSSRLETFAFTRKVPYTPEVWPTIASGLHPREHGVFGAGTSEWSNPIVDFFSRFTGRFPIPIRSWLGDQAERLLRAEYDIGSTNVETVFSGADRVVHHWPGVANHRELVKVWKLATPQEDHTVSEFERDLRGIGIQHFAWIQEMLRHDLGLAGVHDHTLDMGGHIYAREEQRLRELYEWVDNRVEDIEAALGPGDDLLIVSDHGIVCSFYQDEGDREGQPGTHSWRAYTASTDDTLPETVFEVKEWIEDRLESVDIDEETIEIPKAQLADFGYL